MRQLLDEYDDDDGYDDFGVGSPPSDSGGYNAEFIYQRAEFGTEIPENYPGPVTPPSPSITASVSLATGLASLSLDTPSAGTNVSARYTVDKMWYPAVVQKVTPLGDGHNLYTVMYQGYGETEELTLEDICMPKLEPITKIKTKKGDRKKKSALKFPSAKTTPKNTVVKSRSFPAKLGGQREGKRIGKSTPKSSKKSRLPPSKKHETIRKNLISQEQKGNPQINLVVIGHVDAGKSTLMGHLLFKLGEVDNRTMRKFQKESTQMGKGSFAYAWVLDGHEEERTRGITVDVGVTKFKTKTKDITLLDAPGHRDFIPNMISGASQADAAVLVVPAKTGEFEHSFAQGGQTKEHAVLARSLGVRNIIIAINKLDLVKWSKHRYEEIDRIVSGFLMTIGYKQDQIKTVPVSGLTGENLVSSTALQLQEWYEGPTLIGAIDQLSPPVRPIDGPLCMTVSDVFKTPAGGLTVAGKIDSGSIIPKDRLLVLPLDEVISVKSVHSQGAPVSVGRAGQNVELQIRDVEEESWLTHGQIICSPHQPLPFCSEFKVQILTLNYKIPLLTGQNVIVYALGTSQTGYIHQLVASLDKKNGKILRRKPRCIPRNSAGEIVIRTRKPICIDRFRDNQRLGRISIRRGDETVGVGIVSATVRKLVTK